MENIKSRLDLLSQKFNDYNFIHNKGLSNEVGIHIFCYEPCDEIVVQNFVKQIKLKNTVARIIECDLYEIFLKICEEKRVLERLPKMEVVKGKETFKKMVELFATPQAFIQKMKYEECTDNDVILITGVGKVFPYMRCNNILENIQPEFPDIPVIVMYPGKYSGQTLSLFDKFESNYYRAFGLI